MKIQLRYSGLNGSAFWRASVEGQLKKLEPLAAIASAQVTLERQHEVKPAYRVRAHLAVPGPDYHAEASDHTLQAALLKVTDKLERQIRSRKGRRADRRNTNLELGFKPALGSQRPSCLRA